MDLTQNTSFNGYGLDQNQISALNRYSDQFSSQFKNLVGRDPTDGEFKQFLHQYIVPNQSALLTSGSPQQQNTSSYFSDFINNNYQQAAKDTATAQLQNQQGQANQLADLFRTQGNKAISDTESGLLQYQQKLFDRLRPNLITSLQAQGLLNTGGVNQAEAGAISDLATAGSASLMDQRLANEQQANAISYGGAAAPYQFQQGQIMNNVPYLQQTGQQAMQNGYNTFLTNLNFQNQMALQRQATGGNKSKFLQNVGSSFANSLGNNLGQWFSPNAGGQQGSSGAAAMALL